MRSIEKYAPIVGDRVIADIYRKSRNLYGKHILHVNSTFQGGGVAELLNSLVQLFNDVGIDCGWRILHGNPTFFEITKKFHNAMQGDNIHLTNIKKALYLSTNEAFSNFTHINHDCVFIHDPQPLPLIKFFKKRQPWIWRCHIDLSNPNEKLWEFLKQYILRYDSVIISSKKYQKKDLPVDQSIISPVIDPLAPKNMDINEKIINRTKSKYNIPNDLPIITQISRFDKWKDPVGVLNVFKKVRSKIPCRLILCGSMVSDDPEGILIYEKVSEKAKKLIDNGDVILITADNDLLVNVLQRISSVVIQKSIREGFGLTVTEAMWKKTAVVASDVGGISDQISNGSNGYLLKPNDNTGFAECITELLRKPDLAKKIGDAAYNSVKEKYLIIRLLDDYITLINKNLFK